MPNYNEPKKRKQEESKSAIDIIKGFAAKARASGWLGTQAKGQQELQDKYGDNSYGSKKRRK